MKKEPIPSHDWQDLLTSYEKKHGRPLSPVKYRASSSRVPEQMVCPCCNAPHHYLYYNDGKRRSQLLCKVCGELFQQEKRFRYDKTRYYCPYCHHALFTWKQRKEVTIYKCSNDAVPIESGISINYNEQQKRLVKKRGPQFKLQLSIQGISLPTR